MRDNRIEVIARGVEIGTGLLGVTWGEDGKIVFGTGDGIYEVPSDGGGPRLLLAPSEPDEFFAQPELLPGGRTLLFHRAVRREEAAAEIIALDLSSGAQTTLLTDAMDPRYVATGHLMFARRGTLMAVPFDAERMEVTGQPVTVLEGIAQALETPNLQWATGAAQLAVSRASHIAYASGGVYHGRSRILVQLAVGGELEAIGLPQQDFGPVRRSPEGERIAYRSGPPTNRGIYVLDRARGISDRVDPRGRESIHLAWSPDGQSLAVSLDSERPGDPPNIFRISLDARTEPVRLAPAMEPQYVSSWSSLDVIAYLQGPPTDRDIWLLPPDGQPEPFIATPAAEQWADFSPDGRWLAYASDRSGVFEVYVRPYPGPGEEVRISLDGGQSPAWSRDGRRLFYLSGQTEEAARNLMVVERTSEDTFTRPQVLFEPWPLSVFTPVRGYDVLDDDHFVGVVNEDALGGAPSLSTLLGRRSSDAIREVHIVLNFLDELRERVPLD